MATEQDHIKLPGFGLPPDVWDVTGKGDGNIARKISAVMKWQHAVFTIRERCMMFFINKITDKPQWERKVYDDEIVAKWKQEAEDLDWDKAVISQGEMSPSMFTYCIEELRAKAALFEKTGIVPVLDATSCVLKSDTAIPAELKEELRKAVGSLENVAEHQKDWHPGSDGKVLDLVHPSLFPLIYERSRILPDSTINLKDCLQSIGKGTILPKPVLSSPRSARDWHLWSTRFQWLPCNVSFPDGENARIDSYINNLHPTDHKCLYRTLEKLITKAIPFWNIVYQCHESGQLKSTERMGTEHVEYKLPDGIEAEPSEEELADEEFDEDDFYERIKSLRIYEKPDGIFKKLYITPEDVQDTFKFLGTREKKIQVIVKLANIHLTPEKTEYDGGSWHIEGQLNEHIVATALYYYDNNNITDSQLFFRTKVNAERFQENLSYEQNDFGGIKKIFGIENEQDSFLDLGSVLTREDRFIAFPNGFQHRVGSFKLTDPSKPGYRKIVALFLVEPTIPIISTANVPPQQRDWWLREVKARDNRVSSLPAELINMIGEEVKNFPIGLDEAKKLREKLMTERGRLDENVTEVMTQKYGFNFCEH